VGKELPRSRCTGYRRSSMVPVYRRGGVLLGENPYGHDSKIYPQKGHDEKIFEKIGPPPLPVWCQFDIRFECKSVLKLEPHLPFGPKLA